LVSLIDKEKVIEKINDKIKSDFGKDIKYDHEIDLNFFPFPQIKLKNIKFSDKGLNFNLNVKELNLTSSWRSILTLDPEISNLHLFEPKLNFSSKKIVKTNFILVNNSKDSFSDLKTLSKKFKRVIIENGILIFDQSGLVHELKNLNGSLNIDNYYDLQLTFYYSNIKSNFNSKIFGRFNDGFKYQVDQSFLNKNKVFYNGNINLKDKTSIDGKISSKKLDLDEVFIMLSKLNNLKDSKYLLVNNAKNSKVEAKFDVALEKINLKNKPLESTTFKIFIKDDNLFINNFKSNYLDATFKLESEYNFISKKIKGKLKTEGLVIDESFFHTKSKFKIKKAILTCTMDYRFNNSIKNKSFKNFSINKGSCKSNNVAITGIDVNNILSKVDNINTFQDFFDLFNLKKFGGITQMNTLFFNFKFFKNLLNISNFETRNEVVKIKSFGNYNIISKDLNADNKILLKTKKFPSLPEFSVFLNGNLDDYKVTYDFEKVKAVILKKGIDNLIGKRKKIIINPKSIDKILKENPIKELNTEKLFDLFLD
jgi:hypothetical protein